MSRSSSLAGYPIVSRIMKRSICASGNSYTPLCSTGFWVAITMNGRGTA